ncbi:PQQ-binding-like beta-propeller repeat protein [Streptomyces sp. YU58]|uniref:outer membrane protein assembly factor BamB family protein n=1 Tax=Streptomyces sp. SX92 TaxID=3158972 RepID=UPI0027BABBB6|nr:PQQ-binding-like beta-propeller repeat protein [Streptomyces coralus]WLW55469.1 PQQ-binding-like beta-propeller repeat protein [Streptomyces coralus]
MQALRESDPRRIGPYTVLGRLGAGRLGEAYLAQSPRGGPAPAVKVVRAEYAGDQAFRARFRQGVRAVWGVGGPGTHIARVLDADTEAERPWIATEFVDGPNLRDAVLRHGPLPEYAVRLLAATAGEAMVALHARGLVHGNLKPSNILLAADGPQVVDIGVDGGVDGRIGQVGPPGDVFALGTVLAYAAGGTDTVALDRQVDLSGVPERIRWLVEPCLREDPDARPTPAEVVAATGHTPASLRESLRPGWFAPGTAPGTATGIGPVEQDERQLPDRDAEAEAEAEEWNGRVEYLVSPTFTDEPIPGPAGPATPSRRRLLLGLGAGALVAVGAGTGGWLWLRDRDGEGGEGGAPDQAIDGSAPPRPSPVAPPERAVVAWTYDTGGVAAGPSVALSLLGDAVYAGGLDGALHAVTVGGAGTELWRTELGGVVGTPVVLSDGICCVAWSGRRLCAVDPRGRLRWERVFDKETYDPAPVQAGGLVLVSTYAHSDSVSGSVRAYRPDGTMAWHARTPYPLTGRPMVADGVVYVSTRRSLTAVSAYDGQRLWTSHVGAPVGHPALVDGTLVAGSSGTYSVLGFSAEGRGLLWGATHTGLGDANPFVAFKGLAVTTAEGALVALDPDDGSTAWEFRGSGDPEEYSAPTVNDNLVHAILGRTLYLLEPDGRRARVLTFPDLPLSPAAQPVVGARYVYVTTERGIAAVNMTA